jgi:hypothetical protein
MLPNLGQTCNDSENYKTVGKSKNIMLPRSDNI